MDSLIRLQSRVGRLVVVENNATVTGLHSVLSFVGSRHSVSRPFARLRQQVNVLDELFRKSLAKMLATMVVWTMRKVMDCCEPDAGSVSDAANEM